MKTLAIRIGIAASIFLITYLLVSFVELSFDISKWPEDARIVTALFGGGLGFALSTFPYDFEE
jgi:hypothetical protein